MVGAPVTLTHRLRRPSAAASFLGMAPAHSGAVAETGRSDVPIGDRSADGGAVEGAPVKHPSSRALYAYWNERRGSRTAPERGDIEPGILGRALGDSFILCFDIAASHPLRLSGTRMCGLFGRELRRAGFETLWKDTDRASIRDLIATVADDSTGVIAGATGSTEEGHAIELELLLLPLRHRGLTHARQVGVLAPLTVPNWLGSSPVIELGLGSYRYLGVTQEPAAPLPFTAARIPCPAAADGGRPRHGLVVYDGGRDA